MTTQRTGTGQTMAAARRSKRALAAALAAGALFVAGCGEGFERPPVPFEGPQPKPQQPLPEWTPPACERDPATAPPADALPEEKLAWAMTAHWRGKAAASFPGGSEVFVVDVTFEPDGHYKAHSLMPGYAAFYYGADDDVPEKTWDLDGFGGNVDGELEGIGSITIWFGPGNTQRGELLGVEMSEDLSAMRFRFLPTWLGVQPFVYDLRCDPESL
ncbi:hypothetical protein [Polyangium aurulentum]|uniref:hypothetical protein n=1 Tax=Polyangium aurulentum TaxID=2567896 RepID=UPI0010ADB95E|nr:hypothetical protein [Polyangium aurulentum]UQA59580.1 hypothetical protein E8A73_003460 [Polyangium aurulentum]